MKNIKKQPSNPTITNTESTIWNHIEEELFKFNLQGILVFCMFFLSLYDYFNTPIHRPKFLSIICAGNCNKVFLIHWQNTPQVHVQYYSLFSLLFIFSIGLTSGDRGMF